MFNKDDDEEEEEPKSLAERLNIKTETLENGLKEKKEKKRNY